ncbi:putative hydro-lyase [Pseudonocardia nantongensis]|uniref:putative hydro-lyase n=1 Tax=Pseudonocardia nantongensis TaxID=1181885 RepID=UPI00397DC630
MTADLGPAQARERFRAGLSTPTSGWCAGWTQANLIAVPREYAWDVLLFAQRNPKPCPVLDVLEPGEVGGALLDGDIRADLPGYRVYRGGELVDQPSDVEKYWRDDLVAFLIGCSFTFENALLTAGVPVRHLAQGTNVPMYRTTRRCRTAGRLSGPLVVSMRPVPAGLVDTAVSVTTRYPAVHGAPVHVGWGGRDGGSELGITDLDAPDYGDPVPMTDGEVPVFWACGVTPQAAVLESRLPLAITHEPGQMLITDARDGDYLI